MTEWQPIDISQERQKRRQAVANRFQFEVGQDGMSDYEITGGAIIDAMMRGVSFMDIHDAFMASPNPMSLEARLWAAPTIRERWPLEGEK